MPIVYYQVQCMLAATVGFSEAVQSDDIACLMIPKLTMKSVENFQANIL